MSSVTMMALSAAPCARVSRCTISSRSLISRPLLLQQRQAIVTRSASQESDTSNSAPSTTTTTSTSLNFENIAKRLERYDFLSAGIGAFAVTSFFVMRGQDVGTALSITAASTVVALLVNDMFPEN